MCYIQRKAKLKGKARHGLGKDHFHFGQFLALKRFAYYQASIGSEKKKYIYIFLANEKSRQKWNGEVTNYNDI